MADHLTKPLQGGLFKQHRNFIMNLDPTNKYYWDNRSVLEHEKSKIDRTGMKKENDKNNATSSGQAASPGH